MQQPVSLVVEGAPYEQGRMIGVSLKSSIAANIARIKQMDYAILNAKAYQHFVAENMAYISKVFPELLEEMQGIAKGSDLSFDDIVELNIPSYFMLDQFAPECSMILARDKATEDGKTYIIKNRDMRAPIEQVLLKRIYPDGMIISEVTGIGTVTYPASGMNNAGLGVTTTGFWSSKVHPDLKKAGNSQIFFNIHLLLRESKSVDEALLLLDEMPVMNGLNLILADSQKACVVEMTAKDKYVEWDKGRGLLYRTNHYVLPALVHLNPDDKEYPSTFMRRKRIETMLKPYEGHIRFQDLLRITSDHKDGVNGICRHPMGTSEAQTVSSTLIILEDKEIWTTLANPCQALPHSDLRNGRSI